MVSQSKYNFSNRFRGAIFVFPSFTAVIAFSARTLSSDKTIAKYVNSPETEIYQKRNVLYGLFFAKKAIIEKDNCFLVEGNTDVISMFQAGIENVVASSGTSLTADQIRLIRRYTKNITILYDGDNAGIKASFRGIDLILEEGMNVRVVLFPDGDDPDSYARKNSASVISEFIQNKAEDFITFKTNLLKSDADGDPIKMSGLIKDIVASISLIPDAIVRSVYTKQCSELLNIAEQILITEINKIRAHKNKTNKESSENIVNELDVDNEIITKAPEEKVNASYYQEMDVIRLMLNYGQNELTFDLQDSTSQKYTVVEVVVHELQDNEYFLDPIFNEIFNEYKEQLTDNQILPDQYFINHPKAEISKAAIDLIHSPYNLSPNWEKEHNIQPTDESVNEIRLKKSLEEAVLKLKAKKIQEFINIELEELKNLSDEEEIITILTKHNQLQKLKIEIDKKLGRVVS